ncbi:hypothetical protein Syncc9902_0142 [Synechococcus sp. CC9902]|nr:hypothetical protein Syncc9902_0142 [Synechococcus sp. CC9902]
MEQRNGSTKTVLSLLKLHSGTSSERLIFKHRNHLIQAYQPDDTLLADALTSAIQGVALHSQATFPQDAIRLVEHRTLEFVSPI